MDDLVKQALADRIKEHDAAFTNLHREYDRRGARIEELEAKLAKAVEALDEAVYLLRPDEKDMMRQAGVYRIVTTFAELKGQKDE